MPKGGHILNLIEDRGSIQHFSATATADVKTPASGKALRILSFFYYCTADITTELRFKTSGNVIAGLPAKGAVGMNLVGRRPPTGATDETVEIYLSGTGTVKGWICYEEV
jgi:hypothetical protein